MARQKGDGKGRLGGRAKGTPNVATAGLRECIQQFVDDNFTEFVKSWKAIKSPKDKCEIYVKCSNFVLPKLNSVQMDANVKDMSYQEELDELSKEMTETPEQ